MTTRSLPANDAYRAGWERLFTPPRSAGPTLLICGSRSWIDLPAIEHELIARWPTLVLHGGARGADTLAGIACGKLGIPTRVYEAEWRSEGRGADYRRNRWMLEDGKPDLVLAFWDGKSSETTHMVRIAKEAGVSVVVVRPATEVDLSTEA